MQLAMTARRPVFNDSHDYIEVRFVIILRTEGV